MVSAGLLQHTHGIEHSFRQEPNPTRRNSMGEIIMTLRTFWTRPFAFLLMVIGFIAILPAALRVQEVSSVSGTVSDRTLAVIRGVELALRNEKNEFSQVAKTNELVFYQFLRVPPGSGYALTFTRDGFQKRLVG